MNSSDLYSLTTDTSFQTYTLILINEITSGLSILGCVLVIIIYWYFKELRSMNLELAMWLCLSGIFYFITAFFPFNPSKDENKIWCAIQAYMIILFQNSCWIWSSIIGYCSFITVIRQVHLEQNRIKYRLLFIFLAFIIPALLASM